MAESGKLERGYVKAQLLRALATGEHSQSELARRHDVSPAAVSQFASRHAERIADIASRLDDEFAHLWAAQKANRLAELQQDIEDVEALLNNEDNAVKAGVSWAEVKRIKQAAIRAIAEETGQLPGRVQVEHSGSLDVRVNGVDLETLK